MKKLKIAIVENDEDELMFMKQGFTETGLFDIAGSFQTGDELMRFLSARENTMPDLILSDLNMPGKNGYDILEARNNDPVIAGIPIVITSTSSSPMTIDKCMKLGASHYMVKPDTFDKYGPFAEKLHAMMQEN